MKNLFLLLFFSLNLSFLSYGLPPYHGDSNILTGNDESYGEGKISWDEMLLSINQRLDNELISVTNQTGDYYNRSNLLKELDYYFYVFTTYGRPYSEYFSFTSKILQEYQSHFVGLFSRLKSEEEYLEVSKRYNLYRDNDVINDVTLSLVADSGFSSINALPLYNFGITDIEEIGNCAGLDYLSMLSFKEDEMLKGTTFSNVSIKYNKEKINSLNLSNYESILNGSAGNFIPSSENFKSIYKDSNLEVKNGSIDKIFLLDNIKNTNDYELLKGILLLQKWASENFSKQTATSFSSFKYYTQESLCPSSELDLIKNELSLGNPVSVTVTTYDGNGHNLIGYQLYQNKAFKDYYYLRVIDTNKISEDDLFVIFYNTNGLLYGIYSPSGLYAKNKYVYAKKIECSTYDGKLLHKSNTEDNWNKDYNPKVLKY